MVIYFSSNYDLYQKASGYSCGLFTKRFSSKTFCLSKCLRSTTGIVEFAEQFRLYFNLRYIEAEAGHNLVGNKPEIIFEGKEKFLETCIVKIKAAFNKAKGSKGILLVPLTRYITTEQICQRLEMEGFPVKFVDNLEQYNPTKDTCIMVSSAEFADGCEFVGVVILIDSSLSNMWGRLIADTFYIALTRATTFVSIIINSSEEVPLLKSGVPLYKSHVVESDTDWVNVIKEIFEIEVPCNEASKRRLGVIWTGCLEDSYFEQIFPSTMNQDEHKQLFPSIYCPGGYPRCIHKYASQDEDDCDIFHCTLQAWDIDEIKAKIVVFVSKADQEPTPLQTQLDWNVISGFYKVIGLHRRNMHFHHIVIGSYSKSIVHFLEEQS